MCHYTIAPFHPCPKILGRRTADMSLHYSHVEIERVRQAVEKMGSGKVQRTLPWRFQTKRFHRRPKMQLIETKWLIIKYLESRANDILPSKQRVGSFESARAYQLTPLKSTEPQVQEHSDYLPRANFVHLNSIFSAAPDYSRNSAQRAE